jgi:MFS family permease
MSDGVQTVGRRKMITLCYVASGVLLIGTGLLFNAGVLSAMTLTACWMVVFFFASAGASAAYLTGSEIFPMETRAMALAFFYAVGTGIGGVIGPALFGKLVESGEEVNVFYGYLIASVVMIAAGAAEWLLGVDAERRSLEDIAAPLTAEEAKVEASG